eukprot:5065142-Prymnesium_polylepis.1
MTLLWSLGTCHDVTVSTQRRTCIQCSTPSALGIAHARLRSRLRASTADTRCLIGCCSRHAHVWTGTHTACTRGLTSATAEATTRTADNLQADIVGSPRDVSSVDCFLCRW